MHVTVMRVMRVVRLIMQRAERHVTLCSSPELRALCLASAAFASYVSASHEIGTDAGDSQSRQLSRL